MFNPATYPSESWIYKNDPIMHGGLRSNGGSFTVVITSAEEVMFSSASVCLCLLAGLRKNHSTDLHKIQWTGGAWAEEEMIRFWR